MSSKKKPKLGQNFLVDDTARHAIADAIGDPRDRTVIEIGPGHGAITTILAPRCRRLILIELDRALAAELRFRFREMPSVEIVEADVLNVNLTALVPPSETADVIGNLPYYITSDILLKLFAASSTVRRAVLMMQREVAERVSAPPGVRDYGLLSATAQMYARVDNLFTLPPAAFNPPPDVYSTVLRFEFCPRFAELRRSFGQKRKTLRNNLRAADWTSQEIENGWPANIATEARAEALTLEQLAAVYKGLRRDVLEHH